MNENPIVKRGPGRPKGSTNPNFLDISVQDLIQKLEDKNIKTVKVARKWYLGLDSAQDSDTVSPQSEPQRIEFTIS